MKKFLPYAFLVVMMCVAPVAGWWWNLPKNPPPQITGNLWPSCHWEGSQDKNDWIVVFQIDDIGHQKIYWKQQVATGVSQQEGESLCDAYTELGKR
jgi:hypothetical protein